MGIFADETRDHSTEDFTDVLGRKWGVYNKAGTGMFLVKAHKIDDDGRKVIDNRIGIPEECEGQWTKREWAEASIRRYINRLNKETEAHTLRAEQKARTQKREELNAASTS